MRKNQHIILTFIVALTFAFNCKGESNSKKLIVGAEQAELYLSKLKNKKVGLMVNQTSLVNSIHLVDYLIKENIDVKKIFAVEHGFRGEAANGEDIDTSVDTKTGLPIISLYGKKKQASEKDIKDIDIVMFDIQDVGCRFYTYISSMHYMMEACAKQNIEFLVLDRPNPNGDYIDGSVLNMKFKSFVGMHPVPIVHGCTVGEFAQMINGEGWLENAIQCQLSVVPVKHYKHSYLYSLPVKPSPNLPTDVAIRLYPSLCFFEATNVSIGRGTLFPFQVIGFPNSEIGDFKFTPKSIKGMSVNPIQEGKECKGIDLRKTKDIPKFTLNYFIKFYNDINSIDAFWKSKRWIELLAGNDEFYYQVNNGLKEEQIKMTWQSDIEQYKQIRKKYLLYPDFE